MDHKSYFNIINSFYFTEILALHFLIFHLPNPKKRLEVKDLSHHCHGDS